MTRGVFLEPPSLTSPEHAQQQPDLQPPTPTQRLNYHANSSVLPRSLDMNLRIGLFGAGVVGGGVVELIKRYHTNGRLTGQGVSMEIVKICVRSKNKSRDFHIDPSIVFTTDNNDILGDPSINCIVEVMGGITDAKDVVFAALKAGKHVITANKALIAAYISEIQGILKANPSVRFAYEAAVCGGIPIIHTIHTTYPSDTITHVSGIMNGTTNYILCQMASGLDYADGLAEAQAKGYAETDPTADVEGHDVQAKICILAKLAYGKDVCMALVPCMGISQIRKVDFDYARQTNCTIKLLGTASVHDGKLAVYVTPTLIPTTNSFSTPSGPYNMVQIHSENLGVCTYSGPGAGRFATANSVLNDLMMLGAGSMGDAFPSPLPASLVLTSDYTARFYIRILCTNGGSAGVLASVGKAAEQALVVVHTVQNSQLTGAEGTLVLTTREVCVSKVRVLVSLLEEMEIVKQRPVFMPFL